MSELRPRARARRANGIARHGMLPTSRPWLNLVKVLAASLAVVLVSGASVAALTVQQLQSNIETFEIPEEGGPPPGIGALEGGFNILIVGSDTREGQHGIGGDTHGELNDVNMLLHVSGDHTRAVAVSIPRDLVVPVPRCPDDDGGLLSAMSARPINSVLSHGGMGCVVLTVEELTGLDIQYAGMITFVGVIAMSNAVGGVPVCTDGPIRDRYTGLDIPSAGTHMLAGAKALAFLRSRHGVGDGSDLGRISSQQVYLSSLVRTLKSSDTLGDLRKVYSLAVAATQNMALSSSFAQIDTLAAIALALKDIPLENVTFVQYPGMTGLDGVYSGRVAPIKAKADKLFEYLREDRPFKLDEDSLRTGATVDPNAPTGEAPEPESTAGPGATNGPTQGSDPVDTLTGINGQTAADYTCSEAN